VVQTKGFHPLNSTSPRDQGVFWDLGLAVLLFSLLQDQLVIVWPPPRAGFSLLCCLTLTFHISDIKQCSVFEICFWFVFIPAPIKTSLTPKKWCVVHFADNISNLVFERDSPARFYFHCLTYFDRPRPEDEPFLVLIHFQRRRRF
jgi:hypothetical protein